MSSDGTPIFPLDSAGERAPSSSPAGRAAARTLRGNASPAPDEKTWMGGLVSLISDHLGTVYAPGDVAMHVESEVNLAAGYQILDYAEKSARHSVLFHKTDLLIREEGPGGKWTPRVAMECKYGELNSKEALAYNARAEQFKSVHPYLRYGLLIGGYDGLSLPVRVLKNGANFDFIIAWEGPEPRGLTKERLGAIIVAEIDASRVLSSLLLKEGGAVMGPVRMVHRPLTLA